MVPGSAEVRHLRPLRLWARDRTHGSMDLWHSPHPRSDSLSSPDPSSVSLEGLHLVPQPIQYIQRGGGHVDPAVFGQALDLLEALAEFSIGFLQGVAWLDPELSRQVHHRKQHIPNLLDQSVTWSCLRLVGIVTSSRIVRLLWQVGLHLRQFFSHLLHGSCAVGPIESNRSGSLLESNGHQ